MEMNSGNGGGVLYLSQSRVVIRGKVVVGVH